MNKSKFLAALALPAMLAACSQEEIVENTSSNVDLSARKVIENVVLNFNDGGISSRAGLGTTSYNSYAWTTEDGVGACIIDNNVGTVQEWISTNYKYYYTSEGQWKTDALMVEGKYMFYAPYDGTHLGRNNIEAIFPTTQNVLTQVEDNNAIAEFYASGKPVFAGYKQLSAEGQENVISVEMRHIFAYPLFTVVNKYDTRTVEEIANNVAPKYQDITITKVEISLPSGSFNPHLIAKNAFISAKLAPATSGEGLVWDATKHENNATADLFPGVKQSGGNNITASKITINMGDGFTLEGEEELSFHAIMPGAAYASGLVVTAYDADGNKYSTEDPIAAGVVLNPGYRFPAQEYTTEGVLMSSKGTMLTAELTQKNVSPTEIANNEDFIAFLKSRNSRFNELVDLTDEVALNSATEINANNFVMQPTAKIVLNTDMIDALANYCMAGGSVTFDAENVAIATDVTVKEATVSTGTGTFTIVSANGKEFTVKMPATEITATANITTAGTYVVNMIAADQEITVAELDAANQPANVIITGTNAVNFAGVNAAKLNSLNVLANATLNLTGNYGGPTIINQGTLTIAATKVVTSKIVNNSAITNSGIMYGESNVNNGTITTVAGSVTKVASGKGTIVNNVVAQVKASEDQTVTWSGAYSSVYTSSTTGYAVTDQSKSGINHVTITDAEISTTAAILSAPFKGCSVNTVVLSAATDLTVAESGSLAGVTLVFNLDCAWTGDIMGAPEYTNATVRVADGKKVTMSYATISGAQDKTVDGYKTGKVQGDGIGGFVNF